MGYCTSCVLPYNKLPLNLLALNNNLTWLLRVRDATTALLDSSRSRSLMKLYASCWPGVPSLQAWLRQGDSLVSSLVWLSGGGFSFFTCGTLGGAAHDMASLRASDVGDVCEREISCMFNLRIGKQSLSLYQWWCSMGGENRVWSQEMIIGRHLGGGYHHCISR